MKITRAQLSDFDCYENKKQGDRTGLKKSGAKKLIAQIEERGVLTYSMQNRQEIIAPVKHDPTYKASQKKKRCSLFEWGM